MIAGPNTGEAAFVDQLAVGVDDRLDRALRQALDLAEDDLDRPVDHPPLEPVGEDQLERARQIEALRLREPVRQHEVEQVAELDRLGLALVAHAVPHLVPLRHPP